MKLTPHDKPIETGRQNRRGAAPDSFAARCKAAGVKVSPRTIQSRMRRYDLTFEEAVAWKPQERPAAGRVGKKKSYWSKATPGSKLDLKAHHEEKP